MKLTVPILLFWIRSTSRGTPHEIYGESMTGLSSSDTKPQVQLLVERSWSDCQHWSIVPFLLRRPDYGGQAGTDILLKANQALRTGLLSSSPCPESLPGPTGLIFSNHLRTCTAVAILRIGTKRPPLTQPEQCSEIPETRKPKSLSTE
jgi:hypothetical protein